MPPPIPVLNAALVFWFPGSLNYSSKLEDCLGLKVRPKEYFSPEGDLGGVSPF